MTAPRYPLVLVAAANGLSEPIRPQVAEADYLSVLASPFACVVGRATNSSNETPPGLARGLRA